VKPDASLAAELCGVRFAPSNLSDVVDAVEAAQAGPRRTPLTIGYVNPHVVTSATSDPTIAAHLANCDHVCIDGTGVWLALRLWRWGIKRLPAYRVADHLLDSGTLRGSTILIGIEPERIDRAGVHVSKRSPSVNVAAAVHGYLSNEELTGVLKQTPAENILIGAGSPRSEQIATLARATHPNAIIFNIGGGTLNVYAGGRQHAPPILFTLGIDWIHRYITEPQTRPRYRRGIPDFVRAVLAGPNAVASTGGTHS